jgi:hypothetical protein
MLVHFCQTAWRNIKEDSIVYECKMYENGVARKIVGSQRDETATGWRTLHNEELHNLQPSRSIRVISNVPS